MWHRRVAECRRGSGARSSPGKIGEPRQIGGDRADAANLRRYCRARARRIKRGEARQSVPRQYPRSRCHRPCRALLPGQRCHACRRPDRSDCRYRDGGNRIDAADLESLERRIEGLERRSRGTDKEAAEARQTLDLIERTLSLLRDGKPARLTPRKPEEEKAFHM